MRQSDWAEVASCITLAMFWIIIAFMVISGIVIWIMEPSEPKPVQAEAQPTPLPRETREICEHYYLEARGMVLQAEKYNHECCIQTATMYATMYQACMTRNQF